MTTTNLQKILLSTLYITMGCGILNSATKTWDGGGTVDDWSDGVNWDLDTAPSDDDNLIFDGTTRPAPNNDSLTSITNLTYNSGAGSFTLGGNALTLKGDITNNDNSNQEISLNLALDTGTRTMNVASTGWVNLTGVVSGAGNLTKSGTGVLITTGDNTLAGNVSISTGSLQIKHANSLGDTSGSTTVSSGASLQFNPGSGTTFASESLTIGGAGITGDDALKNTNGWNTFGGTIALTADTELKVSNGQLTLSGIISDGGSNYGITKNGGSATNEKTLVLSGSNTFGGAVNINAGEVTVTSSTGLGYIAASNTSTVVASGAGLNLNGGFSVTKENLSIAGAGVNSGGALRSSSGNNTWWGTVTLTDNATIKVSNNWLELEGAIGDGGSNYALTKTGSSNLRLTANNTYGGATNITDGTVTLRHLNALGDSGVDTMTTVSSGAQLTLNSSGGTVDNENFTISGTGTGSNGAIYNYNDAHTLSGTVTLAANSSIGVRTTGETLTLSNVLSDGGSTFTLGKVGDGDLALSGANTYDGITTISGGTLFANNGSGSGTGTGDITIASGGRLGGSGSVDGKITVSAGGHLAAGATNYTAGNLNITHSGSNNIINGNGSGTYIWNVDNFSGAAGTAWDILSFSGSLDVDNSSGLYKIYIESISSAGVLGLAENQAASGSNIKILDTGGAGNFKLGGAMATDALLDSYFQLDDTGYFNGNTAWWLTTDGQALYLNYSVVPEPETYMVGSFLFLLIIFKMRNKFIKRKSLREDSTHEI